MIKTLAITSSDGHEMIININAIECIYKSDNDNLGCVKLNSSPQGFIMGILWERLREDYLKAINELNAMEFAAAAFSVSLGDTKANMAKWAFNAANAMIAESKKENK